MKFRFTKKEKESKKSANIKDKKEVTPDDFKKMMGLSFIHEEVKVAHQ